MDTVNNLISSDIKYKNSSGIQCTAYTTTINLICNDSNKNIIQATNLVLYQNTQLSMLDTTGLQSGINLCSTSQINTGFLYF